MQKVHLIVNVFNGEKYIAETLESLTQQDYLHIFIHCFDNHSTDKTRDIIQQFVARYPNIFEYSTPSHISLVEARLFALSVIRKIEQTPFYFGFCDADDWWDSQWVSKLMAYSYSDYDLLICNGYSSYQGKNSPINSCLSLLRLSPFACPVALLSCLFSSKILEEGKPLFDNRFPYAYDIELWLRRGSVFSYIHLSDRLFYYRIHCESACKRNFFPILRERWDMLKLHNLPLGRFLYGLMRQTLSMFDVSK